MSVLKLSGDYIGDCNKLLNEIKILREAITTHRKNFVEEPIEVELNLWKQLESGITEIDIGAYNNIELAWKTFEDNLKADPEYAYSWHCNIAMPIYDIFHGKNLKDLHKEANNAASRIMMHLFNVETKHNMLSNHVNTNIK